MQGHSWERGQTLLEEESQKWISCKSSITLNGFWFVPNITLINWSARKKPIHVFVLNVWKLCTSTFNFRLHTAALEFGSEQSLNLRKTIAVEQCLCPPGYDGLSCENCGYGYTRRNNSIFRGECLKCDCNGHAASCDPYTLRCSVRT